MKLGIAGVEPVEAHAHAERQAVHRPFVLHVDATLAAHFVGRSQRGGWTPALDRGVPAHQAAVDLTDERIGASVRSKREGDRYRYSQPCAVVCQGAHGVAVRHDGSRIRPPKGAVEIEAGLERVGARYVRHGEIPAVVRVVARRVHRADAPVIVVNQLDIARRQCLGIVIRDANSERVRNTRIGLPASPGFLMAPEARLEQKLVGYRV